MKQLIVTLWLLLFTITSFSQAPTLTAGLSSLTLNKGAIDVGVLTQLITEKRNELEKEALKRFIIGLFPETNYTTRFYVQNCLNILLNEKNPKVIDKEIFELTTNYALALAVAKTAIALKRPSVAQLNDPYLKYKSYSLEFRNQLIADIKKADVGQEDINALQTEINDLTKNINQQIQIIGKEKPTASAKIKEAYETLNNLEDKRKKDQKRIERRKLRHNIVETEEAKTDDTPFGIVLDVVAASLSNMDELKTRGFFKTPVDYRSGDFYLKLKQMSTDTGEQNAKAAFKNALDKSQTDIANEIKRYVTNYDLIKEFYQQKLQHENTSNINADLIKGYAESVQDIVNTYVSSNDFLSHVDAKVNIYLTPIGAYSRNIGLINLLYNLSVAQTDYQQAKKSRDDIALLFNKTIRTDTTYRITTVDKYLPEKDSLKLHATLTSIQNQYIEQNRKISFANNTFQAFAAQLAAADLAKDASAYVSTADSLKAIYQTIQTLYKNKTWSKLTPEDDLGLKDFLKNAMANIKILKNAITDQKNRLTQSGDLLDDYLKSVLLKFSNVDSLKITEKDLPESAKTKIADYTDLLSKIYQQLDQIAKLQKISLTDIQFLEDQAIPQLIKFAVEFNGDAHVKAEINDFRLLSQLLKIKAVNSIGSITEYQREFLDLFAFIKDLDKLDQAQTYEAMLKLLQDGNAKVVNDLDDGKFKSLYIVFSNAIKKYAIVNNDQKYVQVDVVSFLTDLQQYFDQNHSSKLGLYLNIGLNENVFFGNPVLPGSTDPIKYIGFASEKIGLKYNMLTFNKVADYENAIKGDPLLNKRAPFINQLYLITYGSGLLYSIANTSTSSNFDYPHLGFGVGLRFYNALDLNAVVGFPFVKGAPITQYAFYGIGLDVPLGQYLQKLNKSGQ